MANYYLCPAPFGDESGTPDSVLGWAREAIQQGRSYLRMQPAFPYIQEGMDMINGDMHKVKVQALSDAKTELVVRNVKELVASISNVRIIPAFKAENPDFQSTQMLLNKLYIGWQQMVFADRTIRKAWQYTGGGGTGYIGIRWEPNYWYRGKGDIVLDAYGPTDVIPVGLPKNHDIQKAYCVAIKVETPWHELIRRYPLMRDRIKPTRENTKHGGAVVAAAVRYASAALRKFGPGSSQESENTPWAMCDVYHLYVDDDSINTTGEPILMGDPGTSWEYLVPYVGQEVVDARDETGYPIKTHSATVEDARLYPNRRKIVCTDDLVLNPDPTRQVNEYWHSRVPITQLRADDWPWTFLGFPLTKSGSPLEKANIEMMRGMVDMVNNRLSPSRTYDRNTMSKALAETINTRIPNQVIGLDMSLAGDQMKPLLPAEYLNPPAIVPELIQANEQRINHQMGVGEAIALAQSRQLPSGDSFERIMDALGPLIKDQSRNMESSMRDLGEMWKYCVFQFYHAPRIMELRGPDGVLQETLQYKIGDLIPGDIPGIRPDAPQFERARKHSSNFTFSVAPYSLHEINSTTRKLFHLQLMRAGFPIDWWTLADVFDIHNFGKKPMVDDPENPGEKKEASTIFECWIAQQEIQARFAAAMQAFAAQQQAMIQMATGGGAGGAGASGAPHPPSPPGGGGGAAPPGGGGKPGLPSFAPHKTEGRPPSGQNPPAMEQKSDGRSIIRESKR